MTGGAVFWFDDIKMPATRRPKAERRRARRLQSIAKRLKGPKMARFATFASAVSGNSGVTFSYDEKRELYCCNDGGVHSFAHPKRLWTLFDRRHARGRRLARHYMLDLIAFQADDWIVDVGANTGDLGLGFDAIGCPINYIGFEPSPPDYSALHFNVEQNPHLATKEVHQLALWENDAGDLTFYLKSEKADSSLIPIKGATEEVKVKSARLDSVLPRRSYKLLKLEAEGAEPEILRGAEGVIDCFSYVAADVGFERGVTAESTLPEVTNFLSEHGFAVCGYNGSRHSLLFRNSALQV